MIQLLPNEKQILKEDFNEFEFILTDKRILIGNSQEQSFIDVNEFSQLLYSAEKYQPLAKIQTYSHILAFLGLIGCTVGAMAKTGDGAFHFLWITLIIWFLVSAANQFYLKDGIRFKITQKSGKEFFDYLFKQDERDKFKIFYNKVTNEVYALKEKPGSIPPEAFIKS